MFKWIAPKKNKRFLKVVPKVVVDVFDDNEDVLDDTENNITPKRRNATWESDDEPVRLIM